MNCSDGNKIGSNCTFSCNQDSNLVGSKWRECTVTGTWSNSKYCSVYFLGLMIFIVNVIV